MELNETQRETLNQQIESVNSSLQAMEKEVDFCEECPQIQEIKAEMLKQYNYLMAIKTTVDSGCLTRPFKFEEENPTGLINLSDSLYKDNLKAPNWIYGNVT